MKRLIIKTLDAIAGLLALILLVVGTVIGYYFGDDIGSLVGFILSLILVSLLFGSLFVFMEINQTLRDIRALLQRTDSHRPAQAPGAPPNLGMEGQRTTRRARNVEQQPVTSPADSVDQQSASTPPPSKDQVSHRPSSNTRYYSGVEIRKDVDGTFLVGELSFDSYAEAMRHIDRNSSGQRRR